MRFQKFLILAAGLFVGGAALSAAILPVGQPVITSLSVSGNNLNFTATFPPGLAQAVLEIRPTLAAAWEQVAVLDVPVDGGAVEFTIPKPPLETAFFRLSATSRTTTTVQSSAELCYVTIASLALATTNGAPPTEAVFHFQGAIDGSDRILITRTGALWEHVNWSWPAGSVTVNGTEWNASEKNFLTTTGAVPFLPENFSLSAVSLEKIVGRDVVALERTNNALIVYLDDTPNGAAPYEFKIHFQRVTDELVRQSMGAKAHLKISAPIDGSDLLKIDAHAATWTHQAWSPPAVVKLNDVAWDLSQTNVLANSGTNTFLPAGVDFSTTKIIRRQGRDLVTLWTERDAVMVSFADNPNGADDCELEISFGE